MEYQNRTPVTAGRRQVRRQAARVRKAQDEERNRQKAQWGGQANELGVIQGQNGEQGNTTEPQNTKPIGKTET